MLHIKICNKIICYIFNDINSLSVETQGSEMY